MSSKLVGVLRVCCDDIDSILSDLSEYFVFVMTSAIVYQNWSEYFVFVMTISALFYQTCRDVINSVRLPIGFD